MNRSRSVASAFVAAVFSLLHASAPAQEIYKWTDANGKVHYGDRSAAPDSSQKMKFDPEPPRPPPAVTLPGHTPPPRTSTPRPTTALPASGATQFAPPPFPKLDPTKFDRFKKGVRGRLGEAHAVRARREHDSAGHTVHQRLSRHRVRVHGISLQAAEQSMHLG